MTKVDFYILQSAQPQDALTYGCRLAEKALKRGHSIYMHCQSPEQMQELDELLWSFSPESFVPHTIKGSTSKGQDNNSARVIIACDQEPPEARDLLINFATQIPDFFSGFQRLSEIVCQHNDWLKPSRDRYRFYKDRGYPLQTHNIGA